MSKYDDLVTKLKEIFQIDRPELDFGVYRILNARVGEINDYLENRLKAKVSESLAASGANNKESLYKELQEKEAQYRADGIDPESVPKIREMRQKLAEYSAGNSEHENAAFTHLLTFFSRYYDKGDFISQRRYKGDTYAIPYSGEEVVLHWANKDQYYTKSGENFSNYAFKLDDGRSVRFRLVTADTAKDNRKDNDKERRFALIDLQTRILTDDDSDEVEETLLPVAEENGELVLRFEYKVMPKGSKQDDLVAKAVKIVLDDPIVKARWLDLASREPTEKNPQRTLLEKCLTNYTTKNTADYFIHKNLGGFLRRELDFYIKNEVMNLDDVQNAEKFADIEKNLRLIQVLRTIALDLITFLSQLEDFQKKLWLKKKFVVATHYCITQDRIIRNAPQLLDTIAANPRQWEQWDKLGMLGGKTDLLNLAEAGSVDYLKEHPYLMVDTSLFDASFKQALLAAVDNLDESLDGLLIHGDNFQGLNLLQERYYSGIDCIHIDPPYNTATSGFLYKNNYQHSSWLSLMKQTSEIVPKILSEKGVFQCHIDENEYENLFLLLSELALPNCGTIIWDKKNPMLGRKGVATQHEYILWRSSDFEPVYLKSDSVATILSKAQDFIKQFSGVNEQSRQAFARWIGSQSDLTGGERAYRFIEDDGRVYRGVAMGAPEPRADPKFHIPLIHPNGKPCPIPPNGWSRTPETLNALIENNEILWGVDEKSQPQKKVFLGNESKRQLSTVIQDASSGKKFLDALGMIFPYCHPVSLYEQLFGAVRYGKNGVFCDYFAGSGTSAHAVISLNRSDNGKRRYILIEQGDYFEDVIKKRIQKVVYSSDWKDGKAAALHTGISHAFKVLKLESYEDTLNNLQLNRTEAQQSLLDMVPSSAKEDYLLRYFLDIESRGSLLSVEHFERPFDCKLKVTMDSAGAYEERSIDLVETFNYLIGLRVKHIDMQIDKGFVAVIGWLPTGDKALILWRDCEKIGYNNLWAEQDLTGKERAKSILGQLDFNPRDSEFDVVYINGDHNIPAVFTSLETEGGITKDLKIRQIEPEFLSRMFAVDGQ